MKAAVKDKILPLSLFLNILYALFVLNHLVLHFGVRARAENTLKELGVASDSKRSYKTNPNYYATRSLHEVYLTKRAGIVMLGDSITERVNWNELLDRTDIANRGINSDVTEGFLNRLDHVYRLNPKACFIMGGVNDVSWVRTTDIFENYKKIVQQLKEHDIVPIIQSTLYTTGPGSALKNKNIAGLNRMLKKFAQEESVEYIDVNRVLSKDGQLANEYTSDGIHLTAKGYQVWAQEISIVMQKYDL